MMTFVVRTASLAVVPPTGPAFARSDDRLRRGAKPLRLEKIAGRATSGVRRRGLAFAGTSDSDSICRQRAPGRGLFGSIGSPTSSIQLTLAASAKFLKLRAGDGG